MSGLLEVIGARWEGHPARMVRDLAVVVSAFAVLFSVAWAFLNYHRRRPVVQGRRSLVDTSTMFLFYAGYSWLIARDVGACPTPSVLLEWLTTLLGAGVVLGGGVVNVAGRFQVGATWSNQIAIYQQHELIVCGWFRLVRHPLYASLIWMFLGAALAYLNLAALLATLLIFLPAMHWRATQEEQLLLIRFPEYAAYRRRTGEFFPKLSTPNP